MPIRHRWAAHGKLGEKHDPGHLFGEGNQDAEGEEERQDSTESCVVDLRSEFPPHEPAEHAPEKVLEAPCLEQKPQVNVIVPEARANPLLKGKECAQQNSPSNKE